MGTPLVLLSGSPFLRRVAAGIPKVAESGAPLLVDAIKFGLHWRR